MSIRVGNTILPISNVGVNTYQYSFSTTNFTLSSSTDLYELTIPYTSHGIDNIGFIISYQNIDDTYYTILVDYKIDTNKNITLISNTAYNGIVTIYGV